MSYDYPSYHIPLNCLAITAIRWRGFGIESGQSTSSVNNISEWYSRWICSWQEESCETKKTQRCVQATGLMNKVFSVFHFTILFVNFSFRESSSNELGSLQPCSESHDGRINSNGLPVSAEGKSFPVVVSVPGKAWCAGSWRNWPRMEEAAKGWWHSVPFNSWS